MSIDDELRKLVDLHRRGGISDEELAAAARDVVMAGGIATDESAIEKQIAQLKQQRDEIEQLDRDWETERERYLITERFGNRVIPSRWGSIVNALAIVVFCIVWIGLSMIGETRIWFIVFGVFAFAVGLAACAYRYRIASAHDEAHSRYQRRREALLDQHDSED